MFYIIKMYSYISSFTEKFRP